MKIIRTKGLVGLLIATVSLMLVLFVFAGAIAKYLLESQLTSANGAEVNIDNVQVSYWPFRLTINQLQMTDSDKPENNFLEIEKSSLEINTDALLKRQFIVNELNIEKLEFDTKRRETGKIHSAETKTADKEQTIDRDNGSPAAGMSLDFPDIDELINKTQLESDTAFTTAQQKADETKQSWKQIQASLDDKDKWKAYEDRFNSLKQRIKKGKTKDKLKALKELKVLNKEIKTELAELSNNKKKMKADYNALETSVKLAKSAPRRDFEKLRLSYSLDEKNLGNISRLLFDSEISHYIELAHQYYKKAEPYLQSDEEKNEENIAEIKRLEGRWIRFNENNPQPDFLIKRAIFTTVLPSGLFAGEASNIAIDQHINKKPAIVLLTGKELRNSNEERIKLVLDYRDRKKSQINLKYDVKEGKISQYKVAGGSTLPLVMESAVVDLQSDINVENGKLTGGLKSQFTTVKFNSSKKDSGTGFSALLIPAMKSIDTFDINVNLKGRVSSPKIKLDSDIDNKINKGLKKGFNKLKKDYEEKLKARLNERYKDELKKIDNSMSEIKNIRQGLETKQSKLEESLKKYKK